MTKTKFVFRFLILSSVLCLFVDSLYSHHYKRFAFNSTNTHCNNIRCNEFNNFKNNIIFEKHWKALNFESYYKTNLSIYRQICLKIYDSCGKAIFPINVHKDSLKNLFEMGFYFDPYINPDEPFYYMMSYSETAPFDRDYYGFYFSKDLIGIQPFYQSDTIWFKWDHIKKIMTDKEIFLLGAMRRTSLYLFNDLFLLSEKLFLEMKNNAAQNLKTEIYFSQDSTKTYRGIYLQHINCAWLDTNSTLQPETYFSHRKFEKTGSHYGIGTIINSKGTIINEGLYFMKQDQYLYPITGNIEVYGLNVPIDYLDELLTINLQN